MITLQIDITNGMGFEDFLKSNEVPYIYYKTNDSILVTCDKDLCEEFLDSINQYDILVSTL